MGRDAERLPLPSSHPTWVRGLKQNRMERPGNLAHVAPYVGAWIETASRTQHLAISMQSHPTWVRGLKPYVSADMALTKMSHPTWVRGLKHAGS